MGELAVRRNRGYAAARRQEIGKAEKSSGAARSQGVAGKTGLTVSETLQQLLSKAGQAESQIRESRRTLQTGEAALAEVQERLGRIAELIQESVDGETPDREALQAELERLREEISRMLGGASAGGARLFLDEDGEAGAGTEALLCAVKEDLSSEQEGARKLPNWLAQGLTQNAFTPEQLLSALGVGENAGVTELLAAIANSQLDGGSAAGYLAALYLGAVIAGGPPSGAVDPEAALEGLRQLLEKVAGGASPDEAVELLTNGAFTSLEDFQSQFTGGTAPGLADFLLGLLLSGDASSLVTALPPLLMQIDGLELDMLMDLLSILDIGASAPEAASGTAPREEAVLDPAALSDLPDASGVSVLRLGNAQVTGQDLSGVSFDASTNELTAGGTADMVIQGTGQGEQAVLVTGSGTVTLQDVDISTLTVGSSLAHVFSAGENRLNLVQLRPGVALTLGGSGVLRIGGFHAEGANTLRLTGGAVVLEGRNGEAPAALTFPVVLDGPASLAAWPSSVNSADGKPLSAFDVIWKTLFSGWSAITAVEADGKRVRMALDPSSPARLWLEKGDSSHGYPAHIVAFQGRDEFGRPKVRYAYLRWSQKAEAFEETVMYPNPFTVTGGEAGRDWIYVEETQALHILTNRVTAVSGGAGADANQAPFSGRIVLADHIGVVELTLEGVACQVSSGVAFSLGRGNDVALLLGNGTDSRFESGEGCAGISLGDGTSVRIDRAGPRDGGRRAGTLAATGGAGGAGIGRDSGGGRDRTSHIQIQGGVITAAGTGGGAGIGGALGTPVGDISICGGRITATAAFHAAAIGAGVQGACGDILISGTARIVKALGGDPGADIGACLFGGCGKVLITGAADIGSARLRTQAGVLLQMGEDAMTLPQFRLSSRTLGLDRLSVATREAAQAARSVVDADRRWVAQIQGAYSALYTRLEHGSGGLQSVRQYVDTAKELVRDSGTASMLLEDMRRSISLAMRTHNRRGKEDVRQLLK